MPKTPSSRLRSEAKVLALYRELSPAGQAFMMLVIQIMGDLQGHRADTDLFIRWMDALKGANRTHEDKLRTLRTGVWRIEAQRLGRRRVLRLQTKKGGA